MYFPQFYLTSYNSFFSTPTMLRSVLHPITLLKKKLEKSYSISLSLDCSSLPPSAPGSQTKRPTTPRSSARAARPRAPLDSQPGGPGARRQRVGPGRFRPRSSSHNYTRERRGTPEGPGEGSASAGPSREEDGDAVRFCRPRSDLSGPSGDRAVTGAGADRLPRSHRHVRATSQNPGEGG